MILIFAVPGLADDPAQGVRRGKFKMSGTQVKSIFDPVVDEVVALVRGQIAATQKKVKAVLLVGGFGQNAYLRETIRASVDPAIEVMQPPNGWTAVVRGALMKGLSQLEPYTEKVKVAARAARKHYGTEIMSRYDSAKHAKAKSWWDDYDGEYKVFDMSWFITKGSPVTEDMPYTRKFQKVWKVSSGPPSIVTVDLQCYEDPDDHGAPVYKDGASGKEGEGVKHLVRLSGDLSCIPASELVQNMGRDGKMYYVVHYDIEYVEVPAFLSPFPPFPSHRHSFTLSLSSQLATFILMYLGTDVLHCRMTYYSAHTKYCLVHKGVKYDSVTAEYV